MAIKGLSVRKVREVLRLHHFACLSGREIARFLNVSPVTVRRYIRRAEKQGLGWPLSESLDNAELDRRLFPAPEQAAQEGFDKGKRSRPGGRNTRGRHRTDAVPREAETFRPFSPPCRRAHPPGPERIPSARRSGYPERGLALQFNRFRNPYGAKRKGRKTILIQWIGEIRHICIDEIHGGTWILSSVIACRARFARREIAVFKPGGGEEAAGRRDLAQAAPFVEADKDGSGLSSTGDDGSFAFCCSVHQGRQVGFGLAYLHRSHGILPKQCSHFGLRRRNGQSRRTAASGRRYGQESGTARWKGGGIG